MTESGSPVCEGGATGYFSRPCLIYNGTKTEPLGIEPKNVVLFGGNSTEKSSLIDFMAGRSVTKASASLVGDYAPQGKAYSFTLSGGDTQMSLRIFDTVGIEESELDANGPVASVTEEVQRLLTLKKASGIDLLLFCIRAGRFNSSMQQNYHLFSEILCGGRVPLALVFTHLDDEDVTEYWERNKMRLKKYGLDPVAHACIPALPTHVMVHANARVEESKLALYGLFHDALGGHATRTTPSSMRDIRRWLFTIIKKPVSLLTRRMKIKEVTMKLLTRGIILSRGEAQEIAKLIVKG